MLVEAEDQCKHQEGVETNQDEHGPLQDELMQLQDEASCSQHFEEEANETI